MEVAKGSGIELLDAYDTEVDQGGVCDRGAPVFFLIVSTMLSFNTSNCSCSTFSVQIDRVCVSNYQFADIQYRRPHPWSNHTRYLQV
jgi:hypothetical protein